MKLRVDDQLDRLLCWKGRVRSAVSSGRRSRGRGRCGSPQSSCFTRTLAPLWWSRSGVAGSAEAVEAEGAASEHLVLRLWGQRFDPLAEHLRRAREEAVRVRIVGGPHDLVR